MHGGYKRRYGKLDEEKKMKFSLKNTVLKSSVRLSKSLAFWRHTIKNCFIWKQQTQERILN